MLLPVGGPGICARAACTGVLEMENYMMREAPRQVNATEVGVGPWTARLLRMRPPDGGAPSFHVLFGGTGRTVANLNGATYRNTVTLVKPTV